MDPYTYILMSDFMKISWYFGHVIENRDSWSEITHFFGNRDSNLGDKIARKKTNYSVG